MTLSKRTLLVGLLCVGTVSLAGTKLNGSVYVSATGGVAHGPLGTARNSADSQQLIGCFINTYETGSPSVLCSARNVSGTYVSCSSTVPAIVDAARSLDGDGFLFFTWNTSTGKCTQLRVEKYSDLEPKQP